MTHPVEKQYQSLREARRLLETLSEGNSDLKTQAQNALKNFPSFDPEGAPLFFANYNPRRQGGLLT